LALAKEADTIEDEKLERSLIENGQFNLESPGICREEGVR
jgi:hypothetical protein